VHNAKSPAGVPLEIIHRDISPQNILISVEGTPKLLDFGVAKAAGRMAKTEAGTFKGKLRYTAPELLKGQPASPSTDVYSVGVCLYEATTGRARLPSNLNEAQMVSTVMEGRIELPSNVVPDYPPELERIVMWAVDPDPLQRCPSAHALHQALEQFVASGPHASSTQAVAKWVEELFPPAETQTYGRAPASTPTSGSNPSRQHSAVRGGTGASYVGPASQSDVRAYRAGGSISSGKLRAAQAPAPVLEGTEAPTNALEAAEPPMQPVKAAVTSMALLIGLLALGGGIAYVATRGAPKAAPPAVTATAQPTAAAQQPVEPPPPAVPAPPPLQAYLDEAERFLQEKQYGPAMEMLTKAQEEKTEDSQLVIRRTRLLARAERESLLAKARMALQLNDVPAALELSKQVLDVEPSNTQALALFAEARTQNATNTAARARTKRTGKLDITVEPAGMVYVDDEPLGLAPISQHALPPGRHRLEVRLAGYIPLERVVRIQANKSTTLSVKLLPINPDTSPQPVVAHPSAP
jgi:hypothetical protein